MIIEPAELRRRLEAAIEAHAWSEFASTGEAVTCLRMQDAVDAAVSVFCDLLPQPNDIGFGFGFDAAHVEPRDTHQDALYGIRTRGGVVYCRQLYAGMWEPAAGKPHEIIVRREQRLDGGQWHRARCWCGYSSTLSDSEAKARAAGDEHAKAKNGETNSK